MSKIKKAGWTGTLVLTIVLAVVIATFSVWWLRPYPVVTTSDSYLKLSPDGPQRVGTVVSWEKPLVCVPAGKTDVRTYARAKLNGGDYLDYQMFIRTFTRQKEVCNRPNGTTIIIPDWLPNGDYQIHLVACTRNPTPFPECVETVGPWFTVVGQPDRVPGQSTR